MHKDTRDKRRDRQQQLGFLALAATLKRRSSQLSVRSPSPWGDGRHTAFGFALVGHIAALATTHNPFADGIAPFIVSHDELSGHTEEIIFTVIVDNMASVTIND